MAKRRLDMASLEPSEYAYFNSFELDLFRTVKYAFLSLCM